MFRTVPSRRRLWGSLLVFAALMFGLAQPAQAHPLGNFSINLYSRIELGVDQVALTYVVDMAEIPSYQEFGPQSPGTQAQADYLAQKAAELRDGLQLTVDGQRQPLELAGQTISFPPGQAGLFTTRIELQLVSTLPRLADGEQRSIAYEDTNYAGRLGWHEVVVQALPGAQFVQTDVPSSDLSDELRAYPEDMLSSPPDVRTAHVMIEPGGTAKTVDRGQATAPERSTDQFAALLSTTQLTPTVVLLALLTAFGLGAVHALSPGHGKTIVAAYLIGARGTARHAAFLGLTVTATHTIGVFVLGLVTLYASRYVLPEQLYPWLSVVSGSFVIVMGLTLLRQRLHGFYGHAHAYAHHHHHHHTHQHDHEHDQHMHHHSAHEHDHHTHSHAHGAHPHTHLPPGTDGGPITWRSLLMLGISGGLVPCPSALVVMLGAIALGRTGFGLLLIVAFSLGLAGVLTGIGMLFVYGGRWLSHAGQGKYRQLGRSLQIVPIISALVVTVAGCVITAQALLQAGLV